MLTEHRALYEKVSGLRDAEQGKEFELPVQGMDLSRFQPMDIGGYDKYAVRYGKGLNSQSRKISKSLLTSRRSRILCGNEKLRSGG